MSIDLPEKQIREKILENDDTNLARAVLVEGQELFAKNTSALLFSELGIRILGIAGNEKQCLDLILEVKPDIVLLAVRLPDISGFDLIEKIRAIQPAVKIIMGTDLNCEQYFIQALNKGADGLVLKDCSPEELAKAIRVVKKGGIYFSPDIETFPKRPIDFRSLHFPVKPVEILKNLLTPEERKIIGLMTKGMSNREIADALGLTVRAVYEQVNGILLKFGVSTRLEAVLSWAYVEI